MKPCSLLLLILLPVALTVLSSSGEAQPHPTFLDYIKARAAAMRVGDTPPQSLKDWQQRKAKLRAQLLKAWGGFPKQPAPLTPSVLGTIQRDGYRVEKIIFQTLPGVWMTA